MSKDAYQWLEDVEGQKSLDWVRARNAEAQAELEAAPGFAQLREDLRVMLDSDAKIPVVEKIGDHYYNLWQDAEHPRGLWRRTTLVEYRKAEPAWETVLDLDALGKTESVNWVWSGASCLAPEYRRCLVELSRGGADATVTREFDLVDKAFVKDGFERPESKGSAVLNVGQAGLAWIDQDHVYVTTDFGPGSMTRSGYARTVREWTRGTPMSAAKMVYEGRAEDVSVVAYHDATEGFARDFVVREPAFFTEERYLRGADGVLSKVDTPIDAKSSVYREWLLLQLRSPYTAGGKTYSAGALIVTRFDDFMAGQRQFTVLFEPSETTALIDSVWTRHHLIINQLDDVKSRVEVLTPGPNGWQRESVKGLPEFSTVTVTAVDPEQSDDYFMLVEGFLTPPSLFLGRADQAPEQIKAMPALFDASALEVSQHFARSKDGTRVPYFMLARKSLELNGQQPTVLYGYGGFEVALTPKYVPLIDRAWLAQGGVYVLANIRGGSEYGPRWHTAALKANRNKAYEDFAAVAEDLIQRKVTVPAHLGIQGGSNGGLLMGNMMVMYPQLFGAVVCQVPLLDMKRYHLLLAGASWMGEYGNPDTADWDFLQKYSPYHNVRADVNYPPVFFRTSTRDDRVHPAHARKMVAKMKDQGHDVRFYENIEGGHKGAADSAQKAYITALEYAFFQQRLFPKAKN